MTGRKKTGTTRSSKKGNAPSQRQQQQQQNNQKDLKGGRNRIETPKDDQDAQDPPKKTVYDSDPKYQQRVLDIFRRAFNDVLSSPHLTTKLQSVKQALYDRDFARAFGHAENLDAYAARWSPTRALCYASVLCGLVDHYLEPLLSMPGKEDDNDKHTAEAEETTPSTSSQNLKIVSVGGGAAELVAAAALLHQHPSPLSTSITLLDSGPWEDVIFKLTTALTTPPPLSKYASEAAKQANKPFVPPSSTLTPTFLQRDVLALSKAELASLVGGSTTTTTPVLITILFTLNELFTAGGVGKTTAFLLALTSVVPPGSLLLVVDSPGSYSETSVGKEAKRYPMHWLLDRVVVDTTRKNPVGGRRWEKVESRESVWFRLPGDGAGLDYPIQLENMRFQMHLYRAEEAEEEEDES
ncbi:hypothetical protein VTJ04DRAFT_6468 [Mycothermus thermophilus]|uniref:uncharacterized protein n=1 Tax=Humicola insolens TaxID=85995 RepID=UPI003744471E